MERMKEIEIFGIPALFTEKRIDHDTVYPGMYRYELETVNNGPKRVSDTASGTFLGTVLTLLKDKTRAELEALTEPELTAIAAYANAAGSLATTRKGAIAIMPDRAQVEECMKNCPKKGEN